MTVTEVDPHVPKERLTNVDGYTVVYREGRSPRIHLLRPYNQCNTERSKSGRDTVKVEGSREKLLEVLAGRWASVCRWCFPQPKELEEPTGEIAFAEEDS